MRHLESFLCVVGQASSSSLHGVMQRPRVTILKYRKDMGLNVQPYSLHKYNNDNREYCNHPQRRH